MIVVVDNQSGEETIQSVINEIKKMGFKTHISKGIEKTTIGVIGDHRYMVKEKIQMLTGVEKVITVLKPFKLSSRDFHPDDTYIKVNGTQIGKDFVTFAGPCAVESREQIIEAAHFIKETGADILRGGAFKPRTSPYSFQGLGLKALEYLAEAKSETQLPICTEVLSAHEVQMVSQYVDM